MPKTLRLFSLLIALNFNVVLVVAQQGGWTQKANHGGGNREGAVGFAIGTKGYLAFGNTSGSVRNSLWEYDPGTNAWTQKANGSARQYSVAVVINNKAYVGTGEDISFARDKKWNEYDPGTNLWTAKTDFAGSARSEATAFAIGSKAYVGTGFDGTLKKDFWEYDVAGNTWTQIADFGGTARRGATAFAIGTKGYVGTGDDGVKKKDFWEYDPSGNTWTQRADFGGTAREGAVSFSLNNRGYVTTGDGGTGTKDIWEYDPIANAWISKTQLPGQRRYIAAAFAINNKGYVGTGFTDEPSVGVNISDFWEFEAVKVPQPPSNNLVTAFSENTIRIRWKDNSNNETGFSIHRSSNNIDFTQVGTVGANISTYLDEGLSVSQTYYYYVKAINGDGSSAESNTASQLTERYETGIWTKLGEAPASLRVASTIKTFTIGDNIFLPMVVLWQNSANVISNQTWMYDAVTDSWTQKADFPGTPRGRPVTFAIDGKGYVGMGLVGYPSVLYNDLWSYDPITNTWEQKNNFSGAARYGAFSFVIGSKAYVGSGNNNPILTDFWEYDPINDSWTSKANVPTGNPNSIGFSVGDLGFTGLGTLAGNFLYAYNPTTNTWTPKAPFPNGISIVDPSAVAMSNGKVFVVFDDNQSASQMWEYQVANDRWIELPKSPYGRNGKGPFTGTSTLAFHGLSTFSGEWYGYTPGASIASPSDFKAEIIDPQKIQLAWINRSPIPANTIVKLYRATEISGAYTLLTTLPGTTRSYDDNVNTINPVFYKIQIENSQGTSALVGPATPYKQGLWKQGKQLLTSSIYNGVAISINDKGYFGIGAASNSTDANNKAWWEYDPAADTWTQKTLFPGTARQNASAFVADNKGFVGLGQAISGNGALGDFWEYNATTNTWTQKADFAGTPRYQASAIGMDTKGYVFAGLRDDNTYFQDTWEYNATNNTWTAKAVMPGLPKAGTFALLAENGILVGGGSVLLNNFPSISLENLFFDPVANTWVKKKYLPGASYFSQPSFSLGGNAYAYLYDGSDYRLHQYIASSQQWTSRLTIPRASIRGFSIGSKGYIIDNNMFVWSFNPETFLAGPTDLVSQLTDNKVTLTWTDRSSTEEKFIVEQSSNGLNYTTIKEEPANTTTTEVLTPSVSTSYLFRIRAVAPSGEVSQASNTVAENTGPYWSKQAVSNTPYRFGAAIMAIQNKTYYGLGVTNSVYPKDFWSFDPATNVWTQQANFPGEGRSGAVAFASNDKGYVLMGSGNPANPALNDFWKFNATTNSWSLMPAFSGTIGTMPFYTVHSNFAYVGMGFRNTYEKEIWRFDMTSESWTQLTDFPETGRGVAFAFATSEKLLVGGGTIGNGATALTVWELNLLSGTWSAKKNLPSALTSTIQGLDGNFTHNNVGYIFTGGSFWRYYFEDDSWDSNATSNSGVNDSRISYQQGQSFAFAVVSDYVAGPMVWKISLVSTPLNLAEAMAVPTAAVRIKWRKPIVKPDSVLIFRSTSTNGPSAKVGHVTSTDTTFVDSDLTPGTTYYYTVRQVNGAGRSITSNTRSAAVPVIPPAPSLQANLSGADVVLQWTSALSSTQNFVIEKSITNETTFVAMDTITQLTFTDKGITLGQAFYRVYAYNDGGISSKSNIASVLYVGLENEVEGISVYPSPTSGKVFIQIDKSYGPYMASVYTLAGGRVMEKDNSPDEIDISRLLNGIYLLSITNPEGKTLLIKKIIKL